MLFERGDLTEGGQKLRKRNVSTSYGNRKPKNLSVLAKAQTTKAAATNITPLTIAGEVTNINFDNIKSGNTLHLSAANSPAGKTTNFNSEFDVASKTQHTNPQITQKKLLASHRNIMKDTVANFVKDH